MINGGWRKVGPRQRLRLNEQSERHKYAKRPFRGALNDWINQPYQRKLRKSVSGKPGTVQ
jgi:hypothetical protein